MVQRTMPITSPKQIEATSHGEIRCDHGQRRRFVTESLLSAIFQGQLRAGQRLVIQDLATRFHVSPSPIRESLVALEGIGIVDLVPNRGAVVRRVTKTDVKEICQVRRALECQATRYACGRISLDELHDLASELKRLRQARRASASFFRKARLVDSRLHDSIANSCGNAFLAKELNRLKILFRAFRDVSYEHSQARDDFRRLAEEAHEHLRVVEALIANDRPGASQAMARHIRSGVKYWGRALPAN